MLMRIARTQVAAVVMGGIGAAQWSATEEAKLIPNDPGVGFGYSVAISGNTALIGADTPGSSNSTTGAAYVFVRTGSIWTEEANLTASDGSDGDNFGHAVALSGDTALVGANGVDYPDSPDAGAVYVFVRNDGTWSEEAKLISSDIKGGDQFGISVALAGDTAVIGACLDDHSGHVDSGSVYLFVRSGKTWTEQQKLTCSDPQGGDLFGCSVALAEDTAVVGAYYHDHAGLREVGSAYVFVRTGSAWTEQQELLASDAAVGKFGFSVALSSDTVVVGAYEDDVGAPNSGSAYVFLRTGSSWSEQQKLVATQAAGGDSFGFSVALSGDTTLIGAYGANHGSAFGAGSAYVFARNGTSWSEELELFAPDPEINDQFGFSVALSGDTAVAGALRADQPTAPDWGAAFVYRLSQVVTYCTAGTSASGCQALLFASGTPSASAASGFSLLAAGVEGQKDGLFFFGTNGQQANPWGNGSSYQCVVPPVKRCGLLTGTGTVGACDGALSQDLNALWCPACPKPGHNPGAGAVVQAQLWYRDPLSTSNQTTSLSDAIEFVVAP